MDPFRYFDNKEVDSGMTSPYAPSVRGTTEPFQINPVGIHRPNPVFNRSLSAPIETASFARPELVQFRVRPSSPSMPFSRSRPILGPTFSDGAAIDPIRSRTSSTSSSGFGSSCCTTSVSSSPPTMLGTSPPSSPTASVQLFKKSFGHNRFDGDICRFCMKNGETFAVYASHSLHKINEKGEKIVECQVLRKVRCEACGATGDFAHTISHCPKMGSKMAPIALLLKNTPRKCNGSLRRRRSSLQ